jgi:CAAX protease family protein
MRWLVTASRRHRRSPTPAWRGFPPAPLPGQVPPALTAPAAARVRRGRVLAATGIGGAGLLGISLSTKPGSPQFYILTIGLAGTWAAGALGSGPVPVGRITGQHTERRHALAVPMLTGAGAFGLFYAAARLARHTPPLDRAIASVLRYADDGSTPLVLLTASANALAEELFFRGALWDLVENSHPVFTTTLAYAASAAATRNPALVLAGVATSVLFGVQRRTSGGIIAPALSHLTWSLLMLRYLPPLFRTSGRRAHNGYQQVPPETRAQWRQWLTEHHHDPPGTGLVTPHKPTSNWSRINKQRAAASR